MKFPVKNFFSKCDQIRRKLRIWSHLLKKSLMENFIFCSVKLAPVQVQSLRKLQSKSKTIWLNFLTPLNRIFALLLPQNSHILFIYCKIKIGVSFIWIVVLRSTTITALIQCSMTFSFWYSWSFLPLRN